MNKIFTDNNVIILPSLKTHTQLLFNDLFQTRERCTIFQVNLNCMTSKSKLFRPKIKNFRMFLY